MHTICTQSMLPCGLTHERLGCSLQMYWRHSEWWLPCAGVAVYSRRATPLAAWTSGLEVANVVADADRACLVLETGVNQRWRYGNYRRSAENTADARAWEAAKVAAR